MASALPSSLEEELLDEELSLLELDEDELLEELELEDDELLEELEDESLDEELEEPPNGVRSGMR